MMMMMMMWYRTRKLPLHALSNLAFTLPSQDSIFLPTSTSLRSKGANFNSIFTPSSSISQTLANSKRFYSVHPPPSPTDDDAPRGIKGAIEWFFAKSFETVPYTNRTRRILYPRHTEKKLGEADFKNFTERYQENKEWLLAPTHPDSVRVKMVLNKLIDALQTDLKRMGNASCSYNSIAERILMRVSGKTPPATTFHLYELEWDVFVENDPNMPDIPYCCCFSSEGKIVVNQYLVNQFDDIQIATTFGHQVARIVGRRNAEMMTKEMVITYLNNFLGETFTKHIGLRIISLIQKLPSNTRLNKEADDIGLQICASAGYDPEQVVEVYKQMRRKMM